MNHSLKSIHVIVLFVVLFLTTQLSAAIVGTTKGEFSVNQGTASYNLKIDVPPGVAGMEPKLSLNYSSGGGNSYMGVGWGIGGVSAITRCPQTKAVDGANHKFGVKYDANDRFCLDGQRLINVSGAYGADGTEYRTEIDTYSKITQKGIYSDNEGPLHFEVKTKSGLTYSYGHYSAGATGSGSGSAYLVINGHKVFWKVNSITDTFGNKIIFHYNNNYSTGENYLDKVTYAGNTVDYVYESGADKTLGYSGGHKMSMTVRLKDVIVKTGTQEVRRYKVAYTNEASGSKRSKVASITEHVIEGDLKKLSMTYQNSTGKLKVSTKTPATKTKDAHYIDLNGDGCVDAYSNNTWRTGDCKGNWGSWKSTGTNVKNSEIKFADFDGDGDVDFVTYPVTSNYMQISQLRVKGKQVSLYLNSGKGTFSKVNTFSVFVNKTNYKRYGQYVSEPKIGDFNHDGKLDMLILADNLAYTKGVDGIIYLNTGNKFKKSKILRLDIGSGEWGQNLYKIEKKGREEITLVDLNADGLVDIYEVDEDYDIVHFNNGNMSFTKKEHVKIYAEGKNLKFADLNGDGSVDIYQIATGKDKIWINDGKGNFSHKYSPNVLVESKDLKLVDMNGDGYPDIYDVDDNNDNIWLNDGKGNFPSTRSYELKVFCESKDLHFADINGDGITDMIEADSTNKIWFNQAKKPLLTNITNGTDQNIHISYKNMTDKSAGIYAQLDKTNTKPWNSISKGNIPVRTPMNLVYSVKSSNGVGGLNEVQYKYHDFNVNKLHGSQGFRYIINYDMTSKFASGTLYKQIGIKNGDDDEEGYQFTGMPYYSYAGRPFTGTGASKSLGTWGKWLSRTYVRYKDISKRSKIREPYTYLNVQNIYDPDTKAATKNIYHYNWLNADGLGNINKTVDRTYDHINKKSFYKTTYNYYDPANKEKWFIGRLNRAKVVHSQTDGGTVTRSSTFKYDKETGVLSEEVANAGTTLALTKAYTYDAKGNKNKETISGAKVITASTTFGYSSDGKFQTSVTNAEGLSETRTYNAKFGTLASLTGPNGLKTTWTYDGMGRKTLETRADGTWSKWEHLWYGTADIKSRYLYSVKETQSGTSYNTSTYYDSLGRETSKHTSTLGAKRILRYKHYNAKGELYAETLPYVNGQDTKTYIRSYYDKYGRATKVTKPGPSGTTQTYTTVNKNFTSTTTNPKGQRKQTVQNAIGQTLKITDAYGTSIASSIDYKYDAAGNLLSTTDAGGNVITMQYDEAGNKTYMSDPDLGVWYYRYLPTGKLKYQSSGAEGPTASKNFTYKNYDVLGRLINTKTYNRAEYTANPKAYSYNYESFAYGSSAAAVGAKGKVIASYAATLKQGTDLHRERKTITYDTLGRPKSTNTYIYGRGNYLASTTYDAYSRPSTITYPNGYKITNHYQDGILDYVKGSDGKVHYQINDLTAFGEVADATFGNKVRTAIGHDSAGFVGSILSGQNGSYYSGNVQQVRYTYDGLGNVVTRNDDSVTGKYIRDSFTYDAMNRLFSQNTVSNVNGNYAKSKVYRYDKLGNMTHNYSYKGENRSGGYLYGDHIGKYVYNTDKPHAVKLAGSRTYLYDDVGNMTHRNGDTITYNPLNKPAIMKNKNGKEVRFYYGVGGQRFMKTTNEKQTFYLGKGYEEEQAVGSKEVKSTVYITVGGKTVGTHVEVLDKTYVSSNAKYKTMYNRYFHTDALGSITAITNDAGKVVERRSYEPFGKIRAMDYGLTSNHAIIPANTVTQTARAFTGHEQIAELSGLIHMNARVYDSDIGRFLSADTIIQAPHDSQSYNRYSYVRNNPLVFTDPSGHSWFSKLWKKVKNIVIGVVVAVLAVATGGAVLLALGYSSIAAATAAGALGAIVASGAAAGFVAGLAGGLLSGAGLGASLRMGIKGAIFGAISAGVANVIGGAWGASSAFGAKAGRALLHGLSRAAISKAQGGKWSAGFWSGFAGSALAPFAGRSTAAAAIVGGTASVVGGGKFANGAVSAAFVHMYNFSAHPTPAEQRQMDAVLDNDQGLIDVSELFVPLGRVFAGIGKFFDDATSFFTGTYYSSKVVGQIKKGDFHSFPEEVKLFESLGTSKTFTGGDGNIYHRLDISGGYRGYEGNFEFIKNSSGEINHRFFKGNF